MDHRTESGDVVYEILSDIDSEAEEPAQPEEEHSAVVSPARPAAAAQAEVQSAQRSGWVMKQSQDTQQKERYDTNEGLCRV